MYFSDFKKQPNLSGAVILMARRKMKTPGKNGFKYKPKFAVVVLCDDETHQEKVYVDLSNRGHKCKVVSV